MNTPHEDTLARTGEVREDLRFVATDGPVIGSLCTGVAGLDLGVAAVLGGRVAWYCEVDPHAAAILAARLPGVPNLGDLRAVDFVSVAPVEVLTAGFPCQDHSTTAADPARDRRHHRLSRAARLERRSDAALGRHRRHHTHVETPSAERGEDRDDRPRTALPPHSTR
ncbi:DNA cytosine methyltransferase [Amycolatopsis sp. cmx-11-51]|uniref:DNA cytosine methyltransferase n=1 Tax=unclassified Amycolatopsis TaxID=2618356 RepID=UPI0039E5EB70